MKIRRIISLAILPLILVGCSNVNPSTSTSGDPAVTTSKITVLPSTECKLGSVDSSKQFIDDGIGYAKLSSATDGDTASFKTTADNQSVRIRFS